MNKYYHRGKGEVVVPEANRLRFDACDFTQESATAEFNNHLASLTPLPDVKCPDTAPVGWLEGYVERYEALTVKKGWIETDKETYDLLDESERRIFLTPPEPAVNIFIGGTDSSFVMEPAPVEEKDSEKEIERLKRLLLEGFILLQREWGKSPVQIESDWKKFKTENNL